jgi:hypothetical protein
MDRHASVEFASMADLASLEREYMRPFRAEGYRSSIRTLPRKERGQEPITTAAPGVNPGTATQFGSAP